MLYERQAPATDEDRAAPLGGWNGARQVRSAGGGRGRAASRERERDGRKIGRGSSEGKKRDGMREVWARQ